MKLTKFDYIQIAFNVLLIAGLALNVLFLLGHLPQYVTFISLILVIIGCVFTNTATNSKHHTIRTEVSGIKALAILSYITGALWVVSYAIAMFFPLDFA